MRLCGCLCLFCCLCALLLLLQTITHMIDDVLSDALLHKQVQPGQIAFMELSRRSGQPVCTAIHPGQPLEMHEEEGPVSDDFTVVVAGSDINGDILRRRASDGGSRPGGSSTGSGDAAKSWVLASGGFEDAEHNN